MSARKIAQQTANAEAYRLAQIAMADLKSAVYLVIAQAGDTGLRNADIGRALGVYTGHVKHEGHISRTLLSIMESEGVVEQDPTSKRWHLSRQRAELESSRELVEE